MTTESLVSEVTAWLTEAAKTIKEKLKQEVNVLEKSNRTDLVTNVDKEIQSFLIEKITEIYPEDAIIGEEEGYDRVNSLEGRVWIIDPIDGTLNFVLQQENFCIMVALFEDGVGQLGFIYDVMKDELYWGQKGKGVFLGSKPIKAPANVELEDGLLGINGYMYGENIFHAKEIGKKSMGIRITGCAGLEMIAMIKGKHIGYLSNLSPWDYAAGIVLLNEFGFCYSQLNGRPLSFNGREYFAAGTPKAYQEILKLSLSEE